MTYTRANTTLPGHMGPGHSKGLYEGSSYGHFPRMRPTTIALALFNSVGPKARRGTLQPNWVSQLGEHGYKSPSGFRGI